ncbi:MAG: tyrosine--tRNA ligase [Candidatus Aenigmarchaeota archaeon]|nr:tyrosine--tRNA ligase [Candidatus Aenigmarchaeota archaeon]
MDVDEKIEKIKRNILEIVTEDELRELLEEKKQPSAYIGYAPTGKLHIGYYIPVLKIRDLIDCGFRFKFLIADLHAHLDDLKTPWELLDARSKYYEEGIKAIMKSVGLDVSKVEFVKGSSFQLNPEYMEKVLRLAATTTLNRCKRAAAEVVRFGEEPKLGGFIYPLMQAEDVPALNVDVALGGIDQRGTYMLARDILPEIDQKKPICIFTPLMPGLKGGKMSASKPESKIDILDDPDIITKKVKEAFCPAGQKEDNPVLSYVKYIIFPIFGKLIVERPEKYGGNAEYTSYEVLEKDFVDKKLHPLDLKTAVAKALNEVLSKVRSEFKDKELIKKAYPD